MILITILTLMRLTFLLFGILSNQLRFDGSGKSPKSPNTSFYYCVVKTKGRSMAKQICVVLTKQRCNPSNPSYQNELYHLIIVQKITRSANAVPVTRYSRITEC